MSVPAQFFLEFARTEQADNPYGFRFATQTYTLRTEGGSVETVQVDWNRQLLEDLEAVRQPGRDPVIPQRIGEALRALLRSTSWPATEAELVAALRDGRDVVVNIRSAAAELYALPWELLTLRATRQHLGELPQVLLRYAWPEVQAAAAEPLARRENGRILFAYSSAGGQVPAAQHLARIQAACRSASLPFSPARDLLEEASSSSLVAALDAARREGAPIAVLHLLCHGTTVGQTFALMLRAETPEGGVAYLDAGRLRERLSPYAGMVRLVVLAACDSGNSGALGNQLGSLAQTLHCAGFAQVVASRYPLSVAGSIEFTEAFYGELLGGPASVEQAFLSARRRLAADSAELDWASLQIYGAASQGEGRPLIFRPYSGLRAFAPEQRRFFFGREREIKELVADWQGLHERRQPRLLAVDGASGTGKSSVVFAGALTELLAVLGARAVSSRLRPGSAPEQELGKALATRPAGAPLLLIVDQLEELFTQCEDPSARQRFARQLYALACAAESGVSVLLTIRSDYVGRCGELVLDDSGLRLDRLIYDEAHRVSIAQMSPQQLRQVIELPAQRVGLRLENGLVERMLKDVDSEPGALPLLADVLDQLWLEREGSLLTQAAYDRLGGVTGALHGRADALIAALSDGERRQARRLLLRLGRGLLDLHQGVRQRLPVAAQRPADAEQARDYDRALAALVEERLLVLDLDGNEPMVEVAHEALLRRWPLLTRWAQEDRQLLAQLDTLDAWVRQWQQHRTLLSGDQLGYAAEVASRHGEELSSAARELLSQSQAERARAEERNHFARDCLRMLAVSALASDPTRQAAILREVESRDPSAVPNWLRTTIDLMQGSALMLVETSEQAQPLTGVRFRPDGQRFLTTSVDGTARTFGLDGSCRKTLSGHSGAIHSADWSPDGTRLVTAAADATAILHSNAGQECLSGHQAEICHVSFSPDGSRIATASLDGTVRIWRDQKPPCILEVGASVLHAAWSPDGRWLVSCSVDARVRLWPVDGGRDPIVLEGHEDSVVMAAWNASGTHFVTASDDGTARLWSRSGEEPSIVLSGGPEGVAGAAFSPDAATVALALKNGRVLLYALPALGEPTVLETGRAALIMLEWNRQGTGLLAASADGCVYVFRTELLQSPLTLRGHKGAVRGAAWSPDGTRIVSGSSDGKARVWDAVRSELLTPTRMGEERKPRDSFLWAIAAQTPDVVTESASPDGKWRASIDADGCSITISSREDGKLLRALPSSGHEVSGLVWSPDSQRLVTLCADSCARLWSLAGGEPVTLRGHTSSITCAAVSRDGRRVVTGSWDWTARVFNSDGSGEPRVLDGHQQVVTLVAFDPDGSRILTLSDDGYTRLWLESGDCLTLLNAGKDCGVGISSDWRHLVTELPDQTRLRWDLELDPARLIERLWRATSFCLPVSERERYLLETHDMALKNYEASQRRTTSRD